MPHPKFYTFKSREEREHDQKTEGFDRQGEKNDCTAYGFTKNGQDGVLCPSQPRDAIRSEYRVSRRNPAGQNVYHRK